MKSKLNLGVPKGSLQGCNPGPVQTVGLDN